MKDVSFLTSNNINIEASLELLGDIETYNEILGDFLSGFDERITKIKELASVSDMANYAIEVHSLKSDAKYLGMTSLAEVAYEHELKSKDNDVLFVNEHLSKLVETAENYKSIAQQYLG